MTFDIDWIINFGPEFSGVIVAAAYWAARWRNGKGSGLEDILVVGMTAASFPSGVLFMYAALFDNAMLSKLAGTPGYMALAGFAILYVSAKAVRTKFAQ